MNDKLFIHEVSLRKHNVTIFCLYLRFAEGILEFSVGESAPA